MQKRTRELGWLLLCLIVLSCGVSLANAGPAYRQGYPGMETLCIEEDSPIEVVSEELIFDLQQGAMRDYVLQGQVTAVYQMHNPAQQTLGVTMAFPLIGAPGNLDKAKIEITAGGEGVPYRLYIGEKYENNEGMLKNILDGINSQKAAYANFDNDTTATLLRFQIAKQSEEEVYFRFAFDHTAKDALFLTTNISAVWQYEDERVSFGAWTGGQEWAEILVIGEVPPYTVEGYLEEEQWADEGLYTYDVETTSVTVGEYVLQAAKTRARENIPQTGLQEADAHMEEQLLYLFASSLDAILQSGGGIAPMEDIASSMHEERILVLLYEIEFPADETLPVSVSYPVVSSMDAQERGKVKYEFTYLFEPASHWPAFHDLEIEILTPVQAPNIIKSSIPFAKSGERRFVANLSSLPQEALVFSLEEEAEVSVAQRVGVAFWDQWQLLAPVLIGVVVLAVALVLIMLYRRKNKGREDA